MASDKSLNQSRRRNLCTNAKVMEICTNQKLFGLQLQNMDSMESVEALKLYNYKQLSEVICCPDFNCACGSQTYERQLPPDDYIEV